MTVVCKRCSQQFHNVATLTANGVYWCSSEWSASHAFNVNFNNNGNLNLNRKNNKSYTYRVRPVLAYLRNDTIITK